MHYVALVNMHYKGFNAYSPHCVFISLTQGQGSPKAGIIRLQDQRPCYNEVVLIMRSEKPDQSVRFKGQNGRELQLNRLKTFALYQLLRYSEVSRTGSDLENRLHGSAFYTSSAYFSACAAYCCCLVGAFARTDQATPPIPATAPAIVSASVGESFPLDTR